jgi:NAD(P)-dependent dehydrogenase (short-subunit alcohol dehydrogenase family)
MGRVLVTGAGSGIGAACCDVLERYGWTVVRTDLRADGDVLALDTTDEAAWDDLMRSIGPVDGLVTCAGIRERGMIADTGLDAWERHLRVNLTGTWLAIRAFLRSIAPTGAPGSIVTVASVNATIAVPNQAHYVASKGGIVALTRAAALEGAPLGVRANSIAPGPIRTPMAEERLSDPAQVAWLTGRVPLGRIGEPEEIGEVAEFLLSARASYITGEVLYVDGGWAANAV